MLCRIVIPVPKSRNFYALESLKKINSYALVHLPLIYAKNYFGLLMSNDFSFAVNLLLQVINSHLQRICCNRWDKEA